MGNKKIYLAGAMGCYDTFQEMNDWRNKIISLMNYSNVGDSKLTIYNPCDYYNFEEVLYKSQEEVMDFDLDLVLSSDIVVVNLDRILDSPGTIIECALSWKKGIPVLGFGTMPDHPWVSRCFRRVDDTMEELVEYLADFYFYQ